MLMKIIRVTPKKFEAWEIKAFKKRCAAGSDASTYIDYEAEIHVNGKPIAIYKKMSEDLTALLYACEATTFNEYTRTSGLRTRTVNINYSPRNGRRGVPCKPSDLHVSRKFVHDIYVEYGKLIAKHYKRFFKMEYDEQLHEFTNGSSPIFPAYLIEGTTFTGAVANKDNVLLYHTDSANTPNGMSCMIILKANAVGGELVLPELDIAFACQDGYMLLFDGQKYLHGVTPLRKRRGGYRYTVVYYNNKGMSLCLPPEQEIAYYENQVRLQVLKNQGYEG